MASGCPVTYTTGKTGSGKSYNLVKWILTEWAGSYMSGNLYTTIPLIRENIIADYPELAGRVHVIPESVLQLWRLRESGPWEWFAETGPDGLPLRPLQNAVIIIDEIHEYCASKDKKKWLAKWGEWVGYVRHSGILHCEFASQYDAKVAKSLREEAEVRKLYQNDYVRLNPIFGCKNGDWWNVVASWTGRIPSAGRLIVKRCANERWSTEEMKFYRFEGRWFGYYKSQDSSARAPEVHELHGRAWVLGWFLRRNAFNLAWRVMVAGLLLWVLLDGGGPFRIAAGLLQRKAMAVIRRDRVKIEASSASNQTPLDRALHRGPSGAPAASPGPVPAVQAGAVAPAAPAAIAGPDWGFDGKARAFFGLRVLGWSQWQILTDKGPLRRGDNVPCREGGFSEIGTIEDRAGRVMVDGEWIWL